jgi:uncharacterized protein
MQYVAPRWLPGGNLQTIWPALFGRRVEAPLPPYRRERWTTPDGDFVDVDFLDAEGTGPKPMLVLFHGLEGSSRSHYALAFAAFARRRGWHYAVPHFRGCSGEINLAPRAYHSGDFEEAGWVLGRLRERQDAASDGIALNGGGLEARPDIVAVGISLGGNVLMRWVEESGSEASRVVRAAASVSAPLDLAAGGDAIGRGFNRLVYGRMFLSTMRPKALAKLAQHPGLFDRERLRAARDLHDFDDVFTGPVHGFKNADDYWRRCSAKPLLHRAQIPALVLNAANDPFVPASSLPRQQDVGRHVTLWQPAHGGHVGFPLGPPPGHVQAMPDRVGAWLDQHR